MVGAGNDFIFFRHIPTYSDKDYSQLSIKLCDRNFGIGADGIAAFEKLDGINHFKWHFYNNDGSAAEMCGNAARCAVRYINTVENLEDIKIETLCGLVSGSFENDLVKTQWNLKNSEMSEKKFKLASGKEVSGYFINTGVPHFVLLNCESKYEHHEFLEIQMHPEFGKDNTNVTVLDTQGDSNKTKSFERGVKDFTLACGTGVIASAFVLQSLEKQQRYELNAPGGKLFVEINNSQVTLIGPGEIVFNGEINV